MVALGILAGGFWSYRSGDEPEAEEIMMTENINYEPEFSGWVAWWRDDYQLATAAGAKWHTISPFWFRINDNLRLETVGRADKAAVITSLRDRGIKVVPMVGSELTGAALSPVFEEENMNQLVEDLVTQLAGLKADGVDMDLEAITEEDRDDYVRLLTKLKERLMEEGMVLSVAVHAKTGKDSWIGVKGHDLEGIGRVADEVRIMGYDRHGIGTNAGALAPLSWLKEIVGYNLTRIPREKIVMGLPVYGYIWSEGSTNPTPYDYAEFTKAVGEGDWEATRDQGSAELVYKKDGYVGYLSDSKAIEEKIKYARGLGINRFIFWQLGGADPGILTAMELAAN